MAESPVKFHCKGEVIKFQPTEGFGVAGRSLVGRSANGRDTLLRRPDWPSAPGRPKLELRRRDKQFDGRGGVRPFVETTLPEEVQDGKPAPVNIFEQDVTGLKPFGKALADAKTAHENKRFWDLVVKAAKALEDYVKHGEDPALPGKVPLQLPSSLAVDQYGGIVLLDGEVVVTGTVESSHPAAQKYEDYFDRLDTGSAASEADKLHARALARFIHDTLQKAGLAIEDLERYAPSLGELAKFSVKKRDDKPLAPSTTTVSVSPTPSIANQAATLSAAVNGAAGPVTGTVSFFSGSKQLGTATLGPTGTATLSLTNLAVGQHSITAVYGGSSTYATGNPSTAFQHAVRPDGKGGSPPPPPPPPQPAKKDLTVPLMVATGFFAALAVLFAVLWLTKPGAGEVTDTPGKGADQGSTNPGDDTKTLPAGAYSPFKSADYFVVFPATGLAGQTKQALERQFGKGEVVDVTRKSAKEKRAATLAKAERNLKDVPIKELLEKLKKNKIEFVPAKKDRKITQIIERGGVFSFPKTGKPKDPKGDDLLYASLLHPEGTSLIVEQSKGSLTADDKKNLDKLRDEVQEYASLNDALVTAGDGTRAALLVRGKQTKEKYADSYAMMQKGEEPRLVPRAPLVFLEAVGLRKGGDAKPGENMLRLTAPCYFRQVSNNDRKDVDWTKVSKESQELMKWRKGEEKGDGDEREVSWKSLQLRTMMGQRREMSSFDLAVEQDGDNGKQYVIFRNQVIFSENSEQEVLDAAKDHLENVLKLTAGTIEDPFQHQEGDKGAVANLNYGTIAAYVSKNGVPQGAMYLEIVPAADFPGTRQRDDADKGN